MVGAGQISTSFRQRTAGAKIREIEFQVFAVFCEKWAENSVFRGKEGLQGQMKNTRKLMKGKAI
jgi:hypothetical protein